MSTFNIATVPVTVDHAGGFVGGDLLRLGFGTPAQNDVIVRDASAALASLNLKGGGIVLFNGPASLPVACALAHATCHLYSAIGVFDPKVAGYVVAVAHGEVFSVGQIIPTASVKE